MELVSQKDYITALCLLRTNDGQQNPAMMAVVAHAHWAFAMQKHSITLHTSAHPGSPGPALCYQAGMITGSNTEVSYLREQKW